MITPLTRIPCILVAMIGYHKTTTPPHAPPSPEENAPSVSLEILLKQRSPVLLSKVICWSIALAEIAVILASRNPNMWIWRQVLSSLVFSGNARNIRPTILFFIATFAIMLGSYIRWSSYQALGRMFTYEMSIRKDHRLVTEGPYSRVRHPGYTGLFLTLWGMVCWHSIPGSWARECGFFHTTVGKYVAFTYLALISAIIAGLSLRTSKEDEMLKRTFGKEWDEWARRVPYKIVPGIW